VDASAILSNLSDPEDDKEHQIKSRSYTESVSLFSSKSGGNYCPRLKQLILNTNWS
jgi:hypothetical protein